MRPILLAGALFLATLPVKADILAKCEKLSFFNICKIEMGQDAILLVDGAGGERIDVNCITGHWTSKGPNTQEFVEKIITLYCNY